MPKHQCPFATKSTKIATE